MAAIKLYHQTGDDKAKKIQQQVAGKLGFVPEAQQAMGRSGDFLEAMLNLNRAAGKGLDRKTKELICVAVSAVNQCGYCLDAHRAQALQAGVTDEEITAAIEIAAMMSAFNKFIGGLGLTHDLAAVAP